MQELYTSSPLLVTLHSTPSISFSPPASLQRGKSSPHGARIKPLGRRSSAGIYGVLLTAPHANLSLVIRRRRLRPRRRNNNSLGGYAVTAAAPTTRGFDASSLCHLEPSCEMDRSKNADGDDARVWKMSRTDRKQQAMDDVSVGMSKQKLSSRDQACIGTMVSTSGARSIFFTTRMVYAELITRMAVTVLMCLVNFTSATVVT